MTFNLRQKIWLGCVVVANAALWAIPSNVVEEIAFDRHVMLNRYTRTHFTWILGVFVLSVVSLYVDWSTGETYKRRWFKVLVVGFSSVLALGVVDALIRTPSRMHYVRDSHSYRHPPHFSAAADYVDRPTAARSLPRTPPGYPTIPRTLRCDARGYRNAEAVSRAEVVVLGDSFAEGSGVSDEHTWPELIGRRRTMTVYNLGMSGYDPLNYLDSLIRFGLGLQPRIVVCMLFEGNDFRSSRSDAERHAPSVSERVSGYFKQSPLLGAVDYAITRWFGGIGRDGPVQGGEVLDWLPLAIPENGVSKHYAFAPKQLRDLLKDADGFSRDEKWTNTRSLLVEMRDRCRSQGARFAIAFAPLPAHVLLPLVGERLPAEKIRSFAALSVKQGLPPAEEFVPLLLARLDGMESVVREFCKREAIDFISLTLPLRNAAAEGRQVYFTYDQHWTPEGHAVAANVIGEYLQGLAEGD